jgi:hypothetical protein
MAPGMSSFWRSQSHEYPQDPSARHRAAGLPLTLKSHRLCRGHRLARSRGTSFIAAMAALQALAAERVAQQEEEAPC